MNISETSDGIFATVTDEDIRLAAARLASDAMGQKKDGIFYHLGHAFDCEDCGILQAHLRKLKRKNKRLKKRLKATGSPSRPEAP